MRHPRLWTAAFAATLTLTACGRPAAPTASAPGAASVRAASAATAKAKAERFATAVKASYKGQVTVTQAVVTLQADDQSPVRYDFTKTPATGMVVVSMEGYETLVPETKLMASANRLPQILVAIAIQMLLGGAKALVVYYIKHPKDFNQKEAVRAVLIGMGTALVHFLPNGAALDALVPLIIDMLLKIEGKDIKAVCKVFMEKVDAVVDWLKTHVAHDLAAQDRLILGQPVSALR